MNTKNILIVDDEPANIFLMEGLLTANNYNTKTAENGNECLKILENYTPDVILLDIMMPEKSGVETLQEIKKNKELIDIPVIMVSAKTHVTEIEKCLTLGALDYIKKPYEEIELIARVKVAYNLRQKQLKLKSKISQKEDFIRMISHDLRSPFTTIQGFSNLLLDDDSINVDNKETLQFIVDSVDYCVQYFNKLLTWSRLEEGDFSTYPDKLKLESAIDFCIKQYDSKIKEKELVVDKSIPEDFQITADEILFKQMINNLLSNAIKFTPKGKNISITATKKEGSILLKICDEGVGMPNQLKQQIFKNSLVKSTRGTDGEKGSGIGLFICYKISVSHNFKISVCSNIPSGTCFCIEI